jgi:transposase-like protein
MYELRAVDGDGHRVMLIALRERDAEDDDDAAAVSMAVLELLRKHGCEADVGVLCEHVRLLSQRLMEQEVSKQRGTGRYERGPERHWGLRVGSSTLQVPRVREGSYVPSLLEPPPPR